MLNSLSEPKDFPKTRSYLARGHLNGYVGGNHWETEWSLKGLFYSEPDEDFRTDLDRMTSTGRRFHLDGVYVDEAAAGASSASGGWRIRFQMISEKWK